MKKILSIVLLLALLAVALVSCKEPEDPTPAEARTTITAEEWAAACALANFTYEQKGTTVYTMNGETQTQESSAICKRTATVMYDKYVDEGERTREYYDVIEDGVCYRLSSKEDGTFDVWTDEDTDLYTLADTLDFEDATFESLVYNAETKTYDYTMDEDGMTVTYSFYFENGVITKIAATATMTQDTMSATMTIEVTFSNIGTTTVEVPAFDKPSAQ